jgi:deferrochelatase/peroxidase EfeB
VGDASHDRQSRLSRRGFLLGAGGLAAGAALAAPDSRGAPTNASAAPGTTGGDLVPFYGAHQAGVTTAPQRHSYFAAFDVQAEQRSDLVSLLKRWTALAADLCAGHPVNGAAQAGGGVDGGEARGLGPDRLSVNFGLGPSLFGVNAVDRFGLRGKWPMALVEVPVFAGEQISPSRRGGDLTVHACAEDPQVVFHAVHQLAAAAAGAAIIRWAQAGFNESAATNGTPRNLMGFKDGTVNPRAPSQLDQFVWVDGGQDQEWMTGGTYMVVRRIRMRLGRWDTLSVETQERVIGRHKASGAPLGEQREFAPLDLQAMRPDGKPVIPLNAHVRLASAAANWGQMMLRRSYAYNDGVATLDIDQVPTSATDSLDAGLFFCAYQQDPRLAFIPIFAKLSQRDALGPFTVHTASAVAALPPGAERPGEWVGQSLLE